MLSQIEKGTTNPTINTIWKISNGLNVPYTYLLEDDYVKENPVVKKTETVTQHSEDHSYRVFNYYSDNQERNFELFQFELDQEKVSSCWAFKTFDRICHGYSRSISS